MEPITWAEFERVEIRVGRIVSVEEFPEARKPAYRISVDFGEPLGILKTSAQVVDLYSMQDLQDRLVVGVVNFPVKQIGPVRSEFLLTGFHREDGAVVLAVPDQAVPLGARLA